MNIASRSRFFTAALMTVVMVATSLPLGTVNAGMIPTKQVVEPVLAPDQDGSATGESVTPSARERIEAILARTDVRAEMIELGVDPNEADARIASMTEQELTKIAGQLDQLPAGGSTIGTVLIVIFIVFGLAVIADALGLLNIFPFVCSGFECGGQQAAVMPEATIQSEPAVRPEDDFLFQEERAPAFRRDRRRTERDPFARRREPRYQTEQYYEPAPVPPTRNYYEERFGTQRQIR